MSLMNTMTKMAIGFAVAKGMDAVQRKGGIGAVLEGISGAGATGEQAGGLSGGLGALLGQLGGAGASAAATGGIGGMLSQLTSGSDAQTGGLGGLGALIGGLGGARGAGTGFDLEALINQDNPRDEPDEEEVARLMLRAMTQAMRADGDIDAEEKAKLLTLLREGDPQDVEALQALLEAPVDAHGLAADTPRGLETQVYTMSVNAINPDNQAEAHYLSDLAQGLSISPDVANQIHDGLGVPRLFS
ncbi:MAG: DUF533 domain-containing protein [Roseobacter sp.]